MNRCSILILLLNLGIQFSQAQNFDLNSNNLKLGATYVSNPKIQFEFNNTTIQPDSYAHLDSIAQFLSAHDSLVIEVGTHTDSRWSKYYSTRLDHGRSQSIVEYLTAKGINTDRLIAKGYSNSQPILDEKEIDQMKSDREKEEAHAVNRRTEFKVIEIRK